MRFLICSLGSSGDVHPFIGIAARLIARGHAVWVLTNERYADLVADTGATFVSPGEGDTTTVLLGGFDIRHANRAAPLLLEKMYVDPMRPLYERMEPLCIPGETVLVSWQSVVASRLLSERLHIPHLNLFLAPAVLRSVTQPPRIARWDWTAHLPGWCLRLMYACIDLLGDFYVRGPINEFRKELQLPPIRRVLSWLEEADVFMGLYPPWFAPPPADLPANAEICDFALFDGASTHTMPDELLDFLDAGAAPVVFTMGSPAGGIDWFHRESARACEILECRGVLLSQYPDDIPDTLPPGVIHVRYAPFSELLPRAAAFVHHGGIGTCAQAMRAGVRQLIVPWGVDQFDTAAWVAKLGIGAEGNLSRYRADRVAQSIARLLESPEIDERCREVAARFDDAGIERVCTRIEEFGRSRLQPNHTSSTP